MGSWKVQSFREAPHLAIIRHVSPIWKRLSEKTSGSLLHVCGKSGQRERDRETQRHRDGASTQLAVPPSMKAGEQVGPRVWVRMDPPGWGAELRLNSHGNPTMGEWNGEPLELFQRIRFDESQQRALRGSEPWQTE